MINKHKEYAWFINKFINQAEYMKFFTNKEIEKIRQIRDFLENPIEHLTDKQKRSIAREINIENMKESILERLNTIDHGNFKTITGYYMDDDVVDHIKENLDYIATEAIEIFDGGDVFPAIEEAITYVLANKPKTKRKYVINVREEHVITYNDVIIEATSSDEAERIFWDKALSNQIEYDDECVESNISIDKYEERNDA